jgi:hypothetical protein
MLDIINCEKINSSLTSTYYGLLAILGCGGAQNLCAEHATLKSTFWQDAHICGDLHRVQLSSKNMFLPLFINNQVSKSSI